MKIYAVANQKGGVGKTTTAHNLAAGIYRETGKKALLLDFDPQCNLSMACGQIPDETAKSAFDFLKGELFENVGIDLGYADLIPSNPDCVFAESYIENLKRGRQVVLAKRFQSLVHFGYDFVLIDCPGNLGFVTVNAMVAAGKVLVPLQCEYYALEGLAKLLREIVAIKEDGKPVELVGIIPTLWNATTLNRDVRKEVRDNFPQIMYETIIHRNVQLGEAPSHGTHIFEYAPKSTGAASYGSLTREFLRREGK